MISAARRVATLGVGVAVVGVVLSAVPAVLEVEESLGLGWLFAARGPLGPPPEVVIVSLSADSADTLGTSRAVDEWPRARHGELIDRLMDGGAAAIAFDVMFTQPRLDDPEGDRILAGAVERSGAVILAERVAEVYKDGFIGEERVPPIEPLRSRALATAPFMLPLVPVRVSQSWAFGRAGDTPSLPSAVLHAYALATHDRLLQLLAAVRPALAPKLETLGLDAARTQGLQHVMRQLRTAFRIDPTLADDVRAALGPNEDRRLHALIDLYGGGRSRYLNFYGPPRTILTLPYHQVLNMDSASLRDTMAGRAVFVGFSETRRAEQQDDFVAVFSNRSGHRAAGVEIGATMFANMLRGESIQPLPLLLHVAVVAVWGVVVAAAALLFRGFIPVAAGLGLAALFAAASHHLFASYQLWGPLVVPLGVQLPAALLVGLSWNHAVLRTQRERVGAALGYYVPADVVARLAKESLRPHANRELVFGTCLVTDAEQYTTLSELLHPTQLGELMDAYYEALVDVVHRHGGVVSDIGGDSMIAVWPATGSVETTRVAAARAALEVLAAVEAFNRERVHDELPTRIGLDSGQLLLGNVGASVRGEYRAVGDIVNTAARLQGLNRLIGSRVLLSAAAADGVEGCVFRPLGEFLLVGKRTPVAVLELRALADTADPGLFELDAAFATALARFRAGDFAAAHAAFAALAERYPKDRASRFFADQSAVRAERPPERGWDGVVQVTVK